MSDHQDDQPEPGQAPEETLARIRDLLYGGDKRALEANLTRLEGELAAEKASNERRLADLATRLDDLAARLERDKVGRRDLADLLGGIARRLSGEDDGAR